MKAVGGPPRAYVETFEWAASLRFCLLSRLSLPLSFPFSLFRLAEEKCA